MTAGSVPEGPIGTAVAVLTNEKIVVVEETTLTLPSGMVVELQGMTCVTVTVSVSVYGAADGDAVAGEEGMALNAPAGREKIREAALQQATFALTPFSQQ